MPVTVSQSATAVGAGITASFLGSGGTGPYIYSVLPGGAGGSIDATTGRYTAPIIISSNPDLAYDTIQAMDQVGDTGTAVIMIGQPLFLFCDIIQKGLGLANGRVYIWDQKIMQPTDSGLYIAVAEQTSKVIGSSNEQVSEGGELISVQSVVTQATLLIDFISRGPSARERKEELIAVLNSDYSRSQQDANNFYIASLSVNSKFVNLSEVDGAAIPYRYQIPVHVQYMVKRALPTPFFDDFELEVITDPPMSPTPGGVKFWDLVWDAQTQYDVDISSVFPNSRLVALVDVITLQVDGSEIGYPSENWGFYRPSTTTVRITSGQPFTGTLRLALQEMFPA